MWFIAFLALVGAAPFQPPAGGVAVTGLAVNAENGSPVPRGTVALFDRSLKVYNLSIKDGIFSASVPAADGYRLQVWAPGFAEFRLNNVSVYEGMEPLTLKLQPTRAVIGRIVDPEGRGIPRARVGLALDADGAEVQMSVLADDEGVFRMAFASEPRTYYLAPSKRGYQAARPVPFDYPAQDQLLIELTPGAVEEAGSISGVAELGGKPLAGHEVFLIQSDGADSRRVHADSQGEFRFPDLAPGSYLLELRDSRQRAELAKLNLQVEAGRESRAEFHLSDVGISGVVVDVDGEPVRDVYLSLYAGMNDSEPFDDTAEEQDAFRRRSRRQPVIHSAVTDARGRFDFVNVEPGPYALAINTGPQSSYAELRMSVEVPAEEDLRVVLEPGLKLRGVLLDHDGRVIPSFNYSMSPVDGWGSGVSAPVESLQGLFLIGGLQPRLYSFEVGLPDGRRAKCVLDLSLGGNVLFQMPAIDGGDLAVRYDRR